MQTCARTCGDDAGLVEVSDVDGDGRREVGECEGSERSGKLSARLQDTVTQS